ncbi:MAG: hypothetical protein HPY76_01260 [Anaerolineae bacterium]|nr:hypothetical protein [Anaerolineae bacterium]
MAFLGIDCGTQGTRAIVFDGSGRVISAGAAKHALPVRLPDGGVEQDPADLWQAFCRACRQAISGLPFSSDRIIAACLTSQRSSMLAVDRDGEPLRPLFSWMDQRRVGSLSPHLPPHLQALQASAKACWMKQHEPEKYERVHLFLSVSGWLTWQVCGDFVDCQGSVAGVWPFDIEQLMWSQDALLYQAYATPREKLPRVLPPGAPLGTVTWSAAAQTGLPQGLRVFAGSGDKMCEMLGAGATALDQGYITYGSMAGLEVNVPAPRFAGDGAYWTNPAAVPGLWNLEYALPGGYLMLDWFCRQFGQAGCEADLDREAQALPPGSDGLVVAPYWAPNTLANGARSVVLGMNEGHSRAHLFRAMLEGTAFALRQGMEHITTDTAQPLAELLVGGGAAGSDLVMQITADVLGLPAARVQTTETCALGAAMLAAVGAGVFENCQDAAAHMAQRQQLFQPAFERARLYDDIYQQVYLKIYPSLREVYGAFGRVFAAKGEAMT